ncbi:hypothetical protein ASPVEDRAFT_37842 [Aspergillus versicolor CBS 583.65]|uniref:Uncharacterized protein n=1 Tax=Aspergillus versicolor CBS 583.65 TaxID=1036611 RepID=A0A1L9PA80_ASPVE|nr:uncharacterized protein ASPVEDRAFT_37842 [Aspergillus versicolor CBS 583.65]OJI98406.1 hypothetical protein ASPVEDRAFT_37842 [Aspergillus versicolor CBS 583.65]
MEADVGVRMVSAISKHPVVPVNYPHQTKAVTMTKTVRDITNSTSISARQSESKASLYTMSAAASISATKPSLTTNDSAVLQALFDAESSPSSGVTIDPTLPQLPSHLNISAKEHSFLQAREKEIITPLASTTQPTPETLQSAINAFDALITQHPTYPSAYANRAQTLRMLIEPEQQKLSPGTESENTTSDFFTPSATPYLSTLLSDLGQAITLSTPKSPADPVSPSQARLLADSHTHRAYLLLKISRQLKSKNATDVEAIPERLRELGPEGLEEMASRDFFFGGRYGNKVAQQMAVQTNPYAKMCGAIVKEAMTKEIEGGVV